jgi:hypothetical protein
VLRADSIVAAHVSRMCPPETRPIAGTWPSWRLASREAIRYSCHRLAQVGGLLPITGRPPGTVEVRVSACLQPLAPCQTKTPEG